MVAMPRFRRGPDPSGVTMRQVKQLIAVAVLTAGAVGGYIGVAGAHPGARPGGVLSADGTTVSVGVADPSITVVVSVVPDETHWG